VKNEAHTGGHQPVLMPTADAARSSLEAARPSPQVPVAAVAPIIENVTEKYADLKRTVHDYIVTLPDDSPCRDSTWISLLSELVGLKEDSSVVQE
jgi:hypothetical protein